MHWYGEYKNKFIEQIKSKHIKKHVNTENRMIIRGKRVGGGKNE